MAVQEGYAECSPSVRPGYFFFECDTAQSTVTKKSKKGDCLRQSKNRPGSWPKTLSLTTTATAYTHFDPAIEQPGYAKTSEILEDKSQNQRGRPMMLSPRDILPLLCLIAGLLFACNGTKLSLSSAYPRKPIQVFSPWKFNEQEILFPDSSESDRIACHGTGPLESWTPPWPARAATLVSWSRGLLVRQVFMFV